MIAEEAKVHIRTDVIHRAAQEIGEAYLADDRPWVIGFSGGKDSTALLQMIYYALTGLPSEALQKPIYVLASDTRVEAPRISVRLQAELDAIRTASERDGLPLTTHMVYPRLNDTFWVNLVGRGYPPPTTRFRWCTDRLKIYPVSEFVQQVVSRSGDVVIVLGARKRESATRAQAMLRTQIEGNRFRPHASLRKAWVFTPIDDLTTNEVWTYLLNVPNPWNGDNRELVGLYKQASGGECPLVIDRSTPSCGHSRFGYATTDKRARRLWHVVGPRRIAGLAIARGTPATGA